MPVDGEVVQDAPEVIKARGNAAFKSGLFAKAIIFYTDALNAAPEAPERSLILSNR